MEKNDARGGRMIEIIFNILLDAFLFVVVVLLGLIARLFYLEIKKAERDRGNEHKR